MTFQDQMTVDLVNILSDTQTGFAVTALLNGSLDLTGLIDSEYIETSGIESRIPIFTVAETTLPGGSSGNVRHGDTLQVNPGLPGDASYVIQGVQPDGHGQVQFMLADAP